jgi:hypothetical protein
MTGNIAVCKEGLRSGDKLGFTCLRGQRAATVPKLGHRADVLQSPGLKLCDNDRGYGLRN